MEILAMILLQRHRLWKKCSSFPYHKANGNGLATALEKKPTLIPTALVSLSQQWKPTQIFYFLVGDGEGGGGVDLCDYSWLVCGVEGFDLGLKGLILSWRVWSWAALSQRVSRDMDHGKCGIVQNTSFVWNYAMLPVTLYSLGDWSFNIAWWSDTNIINIFLPLEHLLCIERFHLEIVLLHN